MSDGWICLHRALQKKGYYKDSEFVHLWVHILMKANHEPREFMFNGSMIKVGRGQLITGRKVLSSETGINQNKVYRILKFLNSEQQIEQQKTNKYTLITVINYKQHQDIEQQTEQEVNNKRTTTEQQLNTNNNITTKTIKQIKTSGETSTEVAPSCPYEIIMEAYHEILPMCPKTRILTAARKKHIKARWSHDMKTIDEWKNYFEYVSQSNFLTGRTDGSNGRPPFVVTLEWLCKESNYAKVAEQNYHRESK